MPLTLTRKKTSGQNLWECQLRPGAPLRLILIVQSHDILSKVSRDILYTLLCLFRSNLERPEEIC